MPMTFAERLLSRAAGREVKAGQTASCAVDLAMVHEAGAQMLSPLAEMGVERVWDPEKVVAILDHWIPASSEKAAMMHQKVRTLIRDYNIKKFYDVGRHGVCHQLLAEERLVSPGMLVVGTDSHTTTAGAFGAFATGIGPTEMAAVFATGTLWLRVPETIRVRVEGTIPPLLSAKDVSLAVLKEIGTSGALYKAVEYCGRAVSGMPMSERMTLCNMAIEMGAKTGLVGTDARTYEYLGMTPPEDHDALSSPGSEDAAWHGITIEADTLEPLVAAPPSPDEVHPSSELRRVRIDQAFLGSCTNGRIEDLRIAAGLLEGREVAEGVRFLITPASQRIYLQALAEGLIEIFVSSGAVVTAPGCGACFGGHTGVLAPGEVCSSSSNRNFPGRMGSVDARIYLGSPATVAASALTGRITDPREVA